MEGGVPKNGGEASSLYNRQIYAIGEETQESLQISKVLLIGVGSVGMEIAKNIILMVMNSVECII
jgi:ubiquitin-activating enzyme E1